MLSFFLGESVLGSANNHRPGSGGRVFSPAGVSDEQLINLTHPSFTQEGTAVNLDKFRGVSACLIAIDLADSLILYCIQIYGGGEGVISRFDTASNLRAKIGDSQILYCIQFQKKVFHPTSRKKGDTVLHPFSR